MPIIRIQYDNNKFKKEKLSGLVIEIQKIVSDATKIKEVFVWVNSADITYLADPVEIFIEMSANKIENLDNLFEEITTKVKHWKLESGFDLPINITLTPMHWKLAIGI